MNSEGITMKRFLAAASLFVFLFSAGSVFAETNISSKKSDRKSASKNAESLEEQKRKAEEERRKELDNSEWAVTTVQKGGDYAKNGEKDKLVFKNGKVSFDSLMAKGY